MSSTLRIFLIACSAVIVAFVSRRIRKDEFETRDALFWLLLSVCLVLIALFPSIAFRVSGVLGFQSSSNFVFLAIIGLLLIHEFMLQAQVIAIRKKMQRLVQEIAIEQFKNHNFNR